MFKGVGLGLVAVLLSSTALATPSVAVDAAAIPVQVAQTPANTPTAFTWSAKKGADGSVTFSGNVPSADERAVLLDDIPNVTSDTTTVAEGAPASFRDEAAAALEVLGDFDSGSASYNGSGWSLSGTVDSATQAAVARAAFEASPLKALAAAFEVKVPGEASETLDTTAAATQPAAAPPPASAPDITTASPPAAKPASAVGYAWSAERAGDGTVTLSGAVPTDSLKRYLLTRAGPHSLDNTTVEPGAPKDFVPDALHGLDALMTLESGKLLYADGRWSLAGIAASKTSAAAARAALAPSDTHGWRIDISAPVQPPMAAAPVKPPAPADQAPLKAAAPAGNAAAGATPSANASVSKKPMAEAAATAATSTTPAAPAAGQPASETAVPASPSSSPQAAASAAGPATLAAPAAPASPPAATPAASPSTPAAAPAAPPTPFTFAATKAAGSASLSGEVPTVGAKSYLGNILGDGANNQLTVAANPPANFVLDAMAGLRGLSKLDRGELHFDGGRWSLKGAVGDADARTAVLGAIAALPDGKSWTVDIAGPTPLEACQQALAKFAADNSITFDSGTHLSKGASAMLDTLARDFAACPDARIDVEGNTDSDGEADANMALSVARAEAVVAELAKRGVNPQRLYAVGYGETLPLVPNTSERNKAKNRRIEFKLEPATGK